MVLWQCDCTNGVQSGEGRRDTQRSAEMRIATIAGVTLALLLGGLSPGRASDKDETIVTVQVTSADHEVQEGYFALGEQATVMVKPGSDLFRFLSRQRGHKVKIVLTEASVPELAKIER
jgi:hypothetical protein